MHGLSVRAKHQIIDAGYTGLDQLYRDVLEGDVDIERLPNIGHKSAMEIRRWCLSQHK